MPYPNNFISAITRRMVRRKLAIKTKYALMIRHFSLFRIFMAQNQIAVLAKRMKPYSG
jgi:hypothetical protein